MELRCGRLGDGDGNGERCLSADNNGPMIMASDTCKSASITATKLFTEAKENGWKHTKDGWVCPICLKNAER